MRKRRVQEKAIHGGLFAATAVSVVTTFGIVAVLAGESIAFFREVSLLEFLTGTEWTPQFEPRSFGVLPLVCGTFLVVVLASAIAVPIGLGSAIYLSEYASDRVRGVVKPVLELLAGIPSVVFGYFALTLVTPMLARALEGFGIEVSVFNAASASIVVAFMILPTIASLCDDALRAVPVSIRHAAYALGATPFEVSTRVVLPGALSGVLAALVLAVSRAIGETMAVALAAGSRPQITANPLVPIETMTAYVVRVAQGDAPAGSVEYRTIFAVGALLFAITFVMNVFANRILARYHEVYE